MALRVTSQGLGVCRVWPFVAKIQPVRWIVRLDEWRILGVFAVWQGGQDDVLDGFAAEHAKSDRLLARPMHELP